MGLFSRKRSRDSDATAETDIPLTQAKALANTAHLRGRADAGDTTAMVELANQLFVTASIAADQGQSSESIEIWSAAKGWLERAASSGDADSMVAIGLVLVMEESDRQSGIEWLTKASRLGHEAAFPHICKLLDMLDLLKWIQHEHPLGNPAAIKFLREFVAGIAEG